MLQIHLGVGAGHLRLLAYHQDHWHQLALYLPPSVILYFDLARYQWWSQPQGLLTLPFLCQQICLWAKRIPWPFSFWQDYFPSAPSSFASQYRWHGEFSSCLHQTWGRQKLSRRAHVKTNQTKIHDDFMRPRVQRWLITRYFMLFLIIWYSEWTTLELGWAPSARSAATAKMAANKFFGFKNTSREHISNVV